MDKRRALGKGLGALIPSAKSMSKADIDPLVNEDVESIIYMNVADLKPGRYQPRSDFNQEKLNELISSIKEKGVVQPVLARKADVGYELIAGERRLRAAKSLGIDKIPVIVKEVDDANAMELALIENIQREDLNPIEEARAYQRLVQEFGFTQEQIGQAVGKDRVSISNILRLLNLPAKIQQFINDDLLAMGHARALLSISEPSRQLKLCEKIIKKGLSVREAEQLVKPHAVTRRTGTKDTDPYTKSAEDELQKKLGTRVKILHGKKRGKILIEYYSPTDLDRIIDIIKR
jgi:ParB family chromosome partitioning protein